MFGPKIGCTPRLLDVGERSGWVLAILSIGGRKWLGGKGEG